MHLNFMEKTKLAYRDLSRKFHPDKNPGDKEAEKKFVEIAAGRLSFFFLFILRIIFISLFSQQLMMC